MASTQEKWQEIANRGLQDRFDPETRSRFDEAVKRGLIVIPGGKSTQETKEAILPQTNKSFNAALSETVGINEEVLDILPTGLLKVVLDKMGVDNIDTPLDGVGEVAATVASAAAAEPLAGLAGIVQSINPLAEDGAGARAVESVRDTLTFKPKTEEGKEKLQAVAETLEPVGEVFTKAEQLSGDFLFELTGSEAAGAFGASVPTALSELLGLGVLSKMRPGTRLLKDGRPTKALEKALDKQGLDFDSLSPEAKRVIPDQVDPSIIPGGKPEAGISEQALAAQLKSGARDDALAGLKLEGGRVVRDIKGAEAIRQGFSEGLVQSVKTASDASKAKMKSMVRIMRQVKKSERLGLNVRPSDIVGDSVTERIVHIRNKANSAKLELDSIAKDKLMGRKIDSKRVSDAFMNAVDELNIKVDDVGGIKFDFKLSDIAKDRTSQGIIKDVADLLSVGEPDALRAHRLKRQLDRLIDFKKKSKDGLTDAGRNVMKDVRRSLNEVIRDIDGDYARVNDVLSESLNAIESIDDAVGTIDIFGKNADRAIGTKMRALLSNQQGRIKLENALDSIELTAANLGAKFDDDIKDLVMFADALDERFGTVAKTSFQGQINQGVNQVVNQGVKDATRSKIAETAGKAAERARGINDFNAFKSLESLL